MYLYHSNALKIIIPKYLSKVKCSPENINLDEEKIEFAGQESRECCVFYF